MSDLTKDKCWLLEINESGRFVVFGYLGTDQSDCRIDVSELPEERAIKIVGALCELQSRIGRQTPLPDHQLDDASPASGHSPQNL